MYNEGRFEECAVTPKATLVCPTRPTKQEYLQRHEINIQFLSIGCVITVGCKKIPFESSIDAIKALTKYVENPEKSIEEWETIFNLGY